MGVFAVMKAKEVNIKITHQKDLLARGDECFDFSIKILLKKLWGIMLPINNSAYYICMLA